MSRQTRPACGAPLAAGAWLALMGAWPIITDRHVALSPAASAVDGVLHVVGVVIVLAITFGGRR